jgi:hypothetical protein
VTFKFTKDPGAMPRRMLINAMEANGIAYEVQSVDTCEPGTPYFVTFNTFDHKYDYIAAIPDAVFDRDLRIIFYYHEGDHPGFIRQRLDDRCRQHSRSIDCYKLVSANTLADQLDRCCYFNDHEMRYWMDSKNTAPLEIHNRSRPFEFTVLSRIHKWWRATVMADLKLRGVLEHSQWSYNTQLDLGQLKEFDNPIELGRLFDRHVDRFISAGPYACDNLDSNAHNNHSSLVPDHFTQSYCSIVLETFIDIENSGGTFLTEKTFKCIKHGHPFVLVAPHGSLQLLRDMGYRTFDHAIDNSYDLIKDPTERWLCIADTVEKIRAQDMQAWFESCRKDLEHNQQLFCASKADRLNTLIERLK